MAELKINIEVSPFILRYKDSQGQPKAKAISELEITTEPAKDKAEGATEIIEYMFFKIPVSGKTIAQMVDYYSIGLETEIRNAQKTAFVVGVKRRDLVRNLNTIKSTLMARLKQKFEDRYSEITIAVLN